MEQRDDSTSWDFDFDFGAGRSDEQTDRGGHVPADDEPIRKGGGPPGLSAFLPGGRLRRLSRDRGPARVEAPQPTPAAAFHPISDWVFEPGATFEASPAAETPPTAEERRPSGNRTFPGGRARLPRLNPDDDAETEVAYVSTAFAPGRATGDDDSGPRTGFHGYNTYESLFADATIADPLTPPADEDAYSVLGVSREDDWRTVVRAHRNLVKANHPDRLSDAPASVRHEAEERLRQINLAYREVKEHRREEGRPTASADADADIDPDDD